MNYSLHYGSTVFFTIDLTNAYYQVPLHEDSHDLTAFVTHSHNGLFRLCVPCGFQKMMTILLTGLSGVENYFDNFIFHGSDMSVHDKVVLEAAGLQLINPSVISGKQACCPVSGEGLLLDESRVQAILNASPADKAVAPAPVDGEFVAFLSTACNSLSAADVDSCASCPGLIKLCTQISNGWPPTLKGLDAELLRY